jgi:hypothetical protein
VDRLGNSGLRLAAAAAYNSSMLGLAKLALREGCSPSTAKKASAGKSQSLVGKEAATA